MKREKIVTGLTGFVLAGLLSCGAMGAMISGLDLPVEHTARLYMVWLAGAALGAVLLSFDNGWLPLLAAAVLGAVWLSEYSDHILALITRLSALYHSAYHWGILEFAGVEWQKIPADLPLAVWGCCLAVLTAATVLRGRLLSLTLAAALLPVSATLVVTNTPPDSGYLFAVMLAAALLLLTATVRRHSPGQGARLAVLTAIPVGLLLAVLFLLCPQEGYVNRAEKHLDAVVSWCQKAISTPFDRTGPADQPAVGPNEDVTNNLSNLGPRNSWNYTVMEVGSDFSGTVYLRGQDFDGYDGLSWTATAGREERFGGTPGQGGWIQTGTISIRTSGSANVLYLPYYPVDTQTLTGGRVANSGRQNNYWFSVRSPRDPDLVLADPPVNAGFNTGPYTSLPAATRRWAVQYLQANGLTQSTDPALAAAIADHVRGSALYDKNTPRMDGAYEDFARWFLEEAETGYCVHFATAAAVLLRAAGIPARYVTGYMLRTEAGETVQVTADRAHAWAEYYNESLGAWVVVEATPADLTQTETEPPASETGPGHRPEDAPDEPTAPRPEKQPLAPTVPGKPVQTPIDLRLYPLWRALKWLLLPLGVYLAAEGQYRIRRRLRRRGGSPNARALAAWQAVELLCRVTRQTPPGALEALAQKAKFSQHTLTAEELGQFDAWLKEERRKLRQRPWYQRLVYRYVLALW